MNGLKLDLDSDMVIEEMQFYTSILADEVNWVTAGAVTNVKN